MWQSLPAAKFPQKPKCVSLFKQSGAAQHRNKPPNIYCRLPDDIDSTDIGAGSCGLLRRIQTAVDRDVYTVYNLSTEDFNNDIWQASTEILVLCEMSSNSPDEIEKLSEYLCGAGKVLLVLNTELSPASHPDQQQLTIGDLFDRIRADNADGLPLSTTAGHWYWDALTPSEGLTMLVLRKQDDASCPILVVAKMDDLVNKPDRLAVILKSLGGSLATDASDNASDDSDRPTPYFTHTPENTKSENLKIIKKLLQSPEQEFTVSSSFTSLPDGFNWSDYYSLLDTRVLGRSPVWAESLPSSYRICQSILPNLPKHSGLLLVSSIQTAGVGRYSNRWISPLGMACFSFHLSLPFSAQKVSPNLLCMQQHLAGLAVLMSLRQTLAASLKLEWRMKSCSEQESLCRVKLPGYQILIKWPNDVYAVESPNNLASGLFSKICGVLANTQSSDPQHAACLFGVGINVANTKPTVCLHDIIKMASKETGTPIENVRLPSQAAVIACFLNHMEKLLNLCEAESGLQTVANLYTSCWIHSNQKLRVLRPPGSPGSEEEFTVVGVDDFGFLRVRDSHNRTEVLHSDGNSIDMLAGLIIPREHQQ